MSGEPEILRRDLRAILRAGIDGVEPGGLVMRALADDDDLAGVRVVAAGKASAAMAAAAARSLGHRILGGLIVSPEPIDPALGPMPRPHAPGPTLGPADLGPTPRPHALGPTAKSLQSIVGGHPIPTVDSERAGRRALAVAQSVQPGERLLCLLSGGASALMAAPASGVTLADKQATTRQLLRAGADITVLNCVRKHLSDVKGGGLALRSVSGCRTLAISDVVGDDPGVIGSGPGVPDASSYADAIAALRRFAGLDAYPAAVVERLRAGARGELPETLKPSDPRAAHATASVIGSRRDAMDGACAAARELGYDVVRLDRPIVGEARQAAIDYVRDVSARIASREGRVCVVSSGETTVHVTGTGTGGRNQEFVLAAAIDLAGSLSGFVLGSIGTDGIDGPTDAAGAIADDTTLARARRLGLDPADFLHRNDSHAFFDALGDLVVTGRTGTNVGDLQVLLAGKSRW